MVKRSAFAVGLLDAMGDARDSSGAQKSTSLPNLVMYYQHGQGLNPSKHGSFAYVAILRLCHRVVHVSCVRWRADVNVGAVLSMWYMGMWYLSCADREKLS